MVAVLLHFFIVDQCFQTRFDILIAQPSICPCGSHLWTATYAKLCFERRNWSHDTHHRSKSSSHIMVRSYCWKARRYRKNLNQQISPALIADFRNGPVAPFTTKIVQRSTPIQNLWNIRPITFEKNDSKQDLLSLVPSVVLLQNDLSLSTRPILMKAQEKCTKRKLLLHRTAVVHHSRNHW